MNKLKYKLAAFMQGRYGPDDLYKACLLLYLILLVINVFISSLVMSRIISGLLTLLLIFVFFRFFSKNISARQRENAKYLIIKNKIKKSFGVSKRRFTDKEHVYRKCPSCKVTLRFPRKKGTHDAVCPKCQKNIKVKVLF